MDWLGRSLLGSTMVETSMHGPTCLAKTYVGHRIPRAYRIEKASVLWKTRRDETRWTHARTPSAAQTTA